jgi:hypothetical protein
MNEFTKSLNTDAHMPLALNANIQAARPSFLLIGLKARRANVEKYLREDRQMQSDKEIIEQHVWRISELT